MAAIDADVAVIGYGPVGAFTTLLLARAGVRVVAVDRHREVYPLPRAVAADSEIMRLLAAAGLGEAVAAMLPARGARFLTATGHRLLEVDLAGRDGRPGLGLYRQPHLERAIRAAVAARPEATPVLGTGAAGVHQDAGGVTVRLADGRRVRARYAVGCDGARSRTRARLGVPFLGSGEGEAWLVVDNLGTPPPWVDPHRVTYVCDPQGPAVGMPTPGGWRLELLLRPGLPPGPLDEERARRLAGERLATGSGGAAGVVERAAVYRFASRTAAQWRCGRVLLAGDAAHTMPPFAGQGLAAGLRDADALARALVPVLRGSAGEERLDRYEDERRPHLRRTMMLTRVTGALVTAPRGLVPLRDRLLRGAAAAPHVLARVAG